MKIRVTRTQQEYIKDNGEVIQGWNYCRLSCSDIVGNDSQTPLAELLREFSARVNETAKRQ